MGISYQQERGFPQMKGLTESMAALCGIWLGFLQRRLLSLDERSGNLESGT